MPSAHGWLLVVIAVAALGVIAFVGWPPPIDPRADAPGQSPSLSPQASGPEARPTSGTTRLIYPYSVVPGGVLTPEDVDDAMMHDPVVASHYAGLNPRGLRVVRLLEPRDAYVSYRIADQVYWTSRKLHLKVGETVLTDGNFTVRGRCGNQISDAPQGPTSPAEPSAEVLDAPGAPRMLANGDSLLGPGAAAGTSGGASPAAESEWASGEGSTQPRGTVLWPGVGPPRSTESGGPVPPPSPNPPTAGPTPGPDPEPGPNANPGPGPDPSPSSNPQNDPPRHPPPSSDPDGDPVPVPEPTTLVLVGIGAGSAAIRYLRKRRSAQR